MANVTAPYLIAVKNYIYNTLHLRPFYRRQKYDATYCVTIKNTSSKQKKGSIVMPIPQSTSYQLINNISFSQNGSIRSEPKYHNKYFASKISVERGNMIVLTMSFTAEVEPIISDMHLYVDTNKKLLPKVANRFISDSPRVLQIANRLTQNTANAINMAKQLYKFTNSLLTYGHPIEGLYSDIDALDKKIVDCGGYVSLFTSLCHAKNIPIIPVFGFFAGYPENTMHAWTILTDDIDHTYAFDPSSDWLSQRGRTQKSGGFGWVGSDRIVFSKGCDFSIQIENTSKTIDILQNAFAVPENSLLQISTRFNTNNI